MAEASWFEVRRSKGAENDDSGKGIGEYCQVGRLKIHIKLQLTSLRCE